jgi:hypothetical protein
VISHPKALKHYVFGSLTAFVVTAFNSSDVALGFDSSIAWLILQGSEISFGSFFDLLFIRLRVLLWAVRLRQK